MLSSGQFKIGIPTHKAVIEKSPLCLEDTDVIKPSSSPWPSPTVLEPKKDGTTRVCTEDGRLNSITKKDI